MPRFRTPSPAMCVAILGLCVALGGTTWAAASLPAGSVGTAQLKHGAVTGEKVANHTLTGADLDLARLGAVPNAVHARDAVSALHATSADTAAQAKTADAAAFATTAGSAGTVYSTHFETGIPAPTVATAVASLQLPAGSYALSAKSQIDTQTASGIVECDLVAGTDKDVGFLQGGASHQSGILVNSLVHTFASADTARLVCTGFLSSGIISQVRLTAVPATAIVTQP
jgi:hypothetical protein